MSVETGEPGGKPHSQKSKRPKTVELEPETEEEAYEQTLMALEMLSAKLNNGTASVEKGIHGLKKANEIINQNN